jgi:hypothetical protein
MAASRSLLTRGIDLFIRPSIADFTWMTALRMGRSEFLEGARLAAGAIHGAVRPAVRDHDTGALDAMLRNGSITQPLHRALIAEVDRGREEGEWAVDAMLEQLRVQAEQIEGEATVRSIRLVCGARRESIGEDMLTLHRLHVGSHLIVLDDEPTGLWRVQRQRELLLKRGGTVQVEASLGIEEPQVILLEVSVDSASLMASDQDAPEPLPVRVADLNSMTRGGSFWDTAAPVRPWWRLLDGSP